MSTPETGASSIVSADASSSTSFVPTGKRGQVAARAMEVLVYDQPSTASKKLGDLRAGSIVETRGGSTGSKPDCEGGFVPIEPAGFVCLSAGATLDLHDPIVTASFRRPETSAGLPYGYAVVRNAGAPFYTRIPTQDEAKKLEPDWDQHFRTLVAAEADEAKDGSYPQLSSLPSGSLPIEPDPGVLPSWATDNKDDDMPSFLADGKLVPNLSGLAWSGRPTFDLASTCDGEGCVPLDAARPKKKLGISFIASVRTADRRYLLTTDLLLMPADRVRLVRGTSFHGVELGKGLQLPIVFIKSQDAHLYSFDGHRMNKSDQKPVWRSALSAAKKRKIVAGKTYHELADGNFVLDSDVVRLDPIKKLPKWGKDGERWVEINISKQTLLAVDGGTPVYATLVSTGAGGLDVKDEKATPRGIFRVHTKHVASTMDSKVPEAEFELRDVPYIQYFQDGYALHAAYWHDQFGQPKSHGCINLAPLDARWLFFFTKPDLPLGWHSVMRALTGSVVWIHT